MRKNITLADKLRADIPLGNEEMLDIVLHIDESFIEYVNEVNNSVYTLLFKDELGAWYSLSYQCNVQRQYFIFEGQPKRVGQEDVVEQETMRLEV